MVFKGLIMKKYNCTLCMSGSRSLIFSIGNVLLGVKKHSPSLFDRVVVYTDKLPDNDIIALKKIFDFIEIVEYTPKFNSYLSAMYSDPTNQGARLPCPGSASSSPRAVAPRRRCPAAAVL